MKKLLWILVLGLLLSGNAYAKVGKGNRDERGHRIKSSGTTMGPQAVPLSCFVYTLF